MIRFVQYKTDKENELHLLPEVGNAIIDYLKYSRQHSEEPFVFLTSKSPIKPLTTMGIGNIVQSAFAKSGIDIKNRVDQILEMKMSNHNGFVENPLSRQMGLVLTDSPLVDDNVEDILPEEHQDL